MTEAFVPRSRQSQQISRRSRRVTLRSQCAASASPDRSAGRKVSGGGNVAELIIAGSESHGRALAGLLAVDHDDQLIGVGEDARRGLDA